MDKIQQDFPRTPSPIYQKVRDENSASAPLLPQGPQPANSRVLQPQPQHSRSQILSSSGNIPTQQLPQQVAAPPQQATGRQQPQHMTGQLPQLSPMYYPETTTLELNANMQQLSLDSERSWPVDQRAEAKHRGYQQQARNDDYDGRMADLSGQGRGGYNTNGYPQLASPYYQNVHSLPPQNMSMYQYGMGIGMNPMMPPMMGYNQGVVPVKESSNTGAPGASRQPGNMVAQQLYNGVNTGRSVPSMMTDYYAASVWEDDRKNVNSVYTQQSFMPPMQQPVRREEAMPRDVRAPPGITRNASYTYGQPPPPQQAPPSPTSKGTVRSSLLEEFRTNKNKKYELQVSKPLCVPTDYQRTSWDTSSSLVKISMDPDLSSRSSKMPRIPKRILCSRKSCLKHCS